MPYIGNTIRAADDYRLIDDISSGFNGSETSFALQVAGSAPVPFPKSPQQVLISVNGVIQEPDPTGSSGFNLVGTNIVFSSAPTNGHAFFGIIYATADYLNAGGNFPAGSLGAPSITFIGDENTGLFRKSGGSVGFVSDATEIANFDSNGITISSGNIIIPDSIIHNGDTNTKIRFPAADTVSVETGGSERLRVTSSGKLLVGTAAARSPGSISTQFQIEGTDVGTSSVSFTRNSADQFSSNLVFNKSRGASVGSDTVVQSGDTLGIIAFVGNDGTDSDSYAARIEVAVDGTPGSNDMPGRITLHTTADGASSPTERLRITSSGKIGIGTNAPTDFFDLRSTTDNSRLLRVSHPSSPTGAAGFLGFNSDGTTDNNVITLGVQYSASYYNVLNIQRSTQRVGIGTVLPEHPFHVFHAVTNQVALFESGDTIANIAFKDNSTGSSPPAIGAVADDLKIITGDTNRITVKSTGNVGIGTESPGLPLHVKHATSNGVLKVESGDSNCGITIADNSGEVSVRAIGDALTLNTTSSETERLHIMSSGRVGINSGGAPTDIPATSHDTVVVGNSSMTSGGITLEGSSSSGNLGYQFFKGGSFLAARMLYEFSTNSLQFHTATGATPGSGEAVRLTLKTGGDVEINDGNLIVANGHGIDFSATSGTGSSELLDDYEEGTWIPTVTYSNGGGATLTEQKGFYVKIGRQVHCQCAVSASSKGGGSGQMIINGLPFTSSATTGTRHNGIMTYIAEFSSIVSQPVIYNAGATTSVYVYQLNSSSSASAIENITRNNLNDTFAFRAHFMFYV